MTLREADVREADPDLADDLARPRALHPLLPLHALQRDGQRGRPARRAQPRRDVGDHDVRGRAVHRRRSPATSPSSARSARCCRRSTASRRGRGRSSTSRPSAACAPSAATSTRPCARARSSGSSPATTPRSTRAGSATRAASASRTCAPPTASSTRSSACAAAASSPSRGTRRSTRPSGCCARAHGRVVVALSGSETVEQAYALGEARCATGSARTTAMLPEEVSDALDAYRLPLSAIARRATSSSCSATCPLDERAPVVDLWVKTARRNGAQDRRRAPTSRRRRGARRADLVRPAAAAAARRVAALAEKLGLAGKDGCGAFYLPDDAERPRRRRRLGGRSDEEGAEPDSIGLLLVSGDEAADDANVRALAEQAESVIVVSMFQGLAAGWADLVLPGHELPRARRHLRQSRGTAAAAAPDGDAARARTSSSGSRSSPPASASSSRRTRPASSREVSERCYGGLSFGEVGEQAPLRVYAGAPEHVEPPALPEPQRAARTAACTSSRTSRSSPGAAVERVDGAPVPAARSRGRALARRRDGARDRRPATASRVGAERQRRSTLPRPRQQAAARRHRARRASSTRAACAASSRSRRPATR